MHKVGRLRWLGHVFTIQKQNHCRKLTLHKPEGTRRVDRPAVRWLGSVEDLKIVDSRNWRRKSHDQNQWREIVKEAKGHHRL
jgi:hypothetical protein